jgi:hypothetical protein
VTIYRLRQISCAVALVASTSGAARIDKLTVESATAAAFACAGGGDDREIVGQIPDIMLTAGVAQTRTISHNHVVYPAHPLVPNGYLPYYECGAIARSNTPGVSLRSTYFDIGEIHPPGEWAGLNGAHGSLGFPRVMPVGLELIFDGSAAPGTRGSIEIAQNIGGDGIGYIPRVIGIVNVYVTAPNTPSPITWFTVTGDPASISGNRIVLNHPLLNGNPGNRVFVTHSLTPPGATNTTPWVHPVSVSYDAATARWSIRNDDGVPMSPGTAFNVRIDPGAKLLVARRGRGSLGDARTSLVVDDPRANYNPYATIFVTPASSNPHPLAVKYVAPYWRIVNSDGALINLGQRFFVQVLGATAYRDDRWRRARQYNPLGTNAVSNGSGIDIHGTGSRRTAGDSRYLDFFWARRASVPLVITANQTPIGRDAFIDASYTGVAFSGIPSPLTWTLRHEAGGTMANNSSFNVWGPANTSIRPPVDSIRDRDRVIREQ